MTDKTYNGWSNYATWRINLEIFDGFESSDYDLSDAYEFAQFLQEYAEEIIFSSISYDERRPTNLVEDYARAFLQDVSWREIADAIIANHISENQA